MSSEPPPGSEPPAGSGPPHPPGGRPPRPDDGAQGGDPHPEGPHSGAPRPGDPYASGPSESGGSPYGGGNPYSGGGDPYGGGSHEGGGPHGGNPYEGGPPYGGGSHEGSGPYGGGSYGGDSYGGGPYGGGPPPGGPLAGMPPLAESGRRTLARIIDLILVGIVVWVVTWALRVNESTMNADQVEVGTSIWQSVVGVVLYLAYDTFMTARSGQTLGKKWLGMRVADLSDGSTPSAATALGRAAVLWVPFWFCCACLWLAVCGGWSYFDRPYKQGLHDKAAKTVVVSTGTGR
ncbi:RDD family protein [Streptomyces sp. NRRL S-340]|uniref:RDD family protein n=1 Tax=Streptomyces sp. NRRL S-340 TaxID=1463901 RepID=UPI00055E9EA1|nr:RDD family protein [Streptomyces sp. NRRL S-340]